MDQTLPLGPPPSLLPLDAPFTNAMARRAGLGRAAVQRMLLAGTCRRLLRGVYVATDVPDSEGIRAAAVSLALRSGAVAVDRTAAWVHGAQLPPDVMGSPVPLEVVSTARRGAATARRLDPRDLSRTGSLCLTTRLRTALDLGRLLRPDRALGALDLLLASGEFTQTELLAEVPRFAGLPGAGQLRALAAQADARATGSAESSLRLHWNGAQLPTPVPGMVVCAGGRLVRLSLAVPSHQFGAALADQVCAADLVVLQGAGWRVVVLSEERVLHSDPAAWVQHLEREFHQQLLGQSG